MLLHFIYHTYCLKHTFPLLLILSFYFSLLWGRGPCLVPSQIGRKKNGIMAVGIVVTVDMEGNTGLTLAVRKQHGTHCMTNVHVSVSTPCGPWCPSLLATCTSSCCGVGEGPAGTPRQNGQQEAGSDGGLQTAGVGHTHKCEEILGEGVPSGLCPNIPWILNNTAPHHWASESEEREGCWLGLSEVLALDTVSCQK